MWMILDDELTNTDFLPLPEHAMQAPYPSSLWRIDEEYNNGFPWHELLPDISYIPRTGAFMNAAELKSAHIPYSVKSIGRYAFAGTALETVTIADDCEYYPTSFPEGCKISFYGGAEEYVQLADSEGYCLIDSDRAKIYVRSD